MEETEKRRSGEGKRRNGNKKRYMLLVVNTWWRDHLTKRTMMIEFL